MILATGQRDEWPIGAQCLQAWPPIGCWHQLIPGSGPAITSQTVLLVTQCSQAGTLLCTAVQCSAVYSEARLVQWHTGDDNWPQACSLYRVCLYTVHCTLFRVECVVLCSVQLLSPSSRSWEALLHFTMAVKGNLNYMAVRPWSSVIEMQILQCVVFIV